MHLECSAQPAEGAAVLSAMASRNARSLDTGPSSSREATKAAAWMWHMHLSCSPSPLSRPATELSDQSTAAWEAKKRRSSFDRSDSRFRQEAASMASASDSGPPPDDATTPSKSKQESVGVWDCGSELYDTFELVSFSNSLDRSLVSASASVDGPAVDQGQSQAHAQPSPPPSRGSFAGVIRTSSLPINFSDENSVPSAGYGHGSDPRLDVPNRTANEAVDEGRSSSNFDGRPSAYIHSKFSPLHHSLSKVAQIMKKLARTHPQLDCFGSQAASRLRSFMSRRSEDEEDDARMPRTQSALPASGNDRNFNPGRRRCEAMEDVDAAEKEYQCGLHEEKMKWGKCGRNFYHHHHHYHHHFVHYVDQCTNERNLGDRMDVVGIR